MSTLRPSRARNVLTKEDEATLLMKQPIICDDLASRNLSRLVLSIYRPKKMNHFSFVVTLRWEPCYKTLRVPKEEPVYTMGFVFGLKS